MFHIFHKIISIESSDTVGYCMCIKCNKRFYKYTDDYFWKIDENSFHYNLYLKHLQSIIEYDKFLLRKEKVSKIKKEHIINYQLIKKGLKTND